MSFCNLLNYSDASTRSARSYSLLLVGVVGLVVGCTSERPPDQPAKVVINPLNLEERERPEEEVRVVKEIVDAGGAVSQLEGNALVTLSESTQTDEDFDRVVYLNNLQKVTVLYVHSDKLNDRTMATFAKLSDLERIQIGSPSITDAGFAHFAGLEKLNSLDVTAPAITDVALEHLAGLTNLTHVRLTGTKITGTGLSHLVGLTKLKSIALDNAPVTDEGLKYLVQLPALQDLDLRGSKVTDAGIALLHDHPTLTTLVLYGAPVTPAAAQSLRDANSRFRVAVYQ